MIFIQFVTMKGKLQNYDNAVCVITGGNTFYGIMSRRNLFPVAEPAVIGIGVDAPDFSLVCGPVHLCCYSDDGGQADFNWYYCSVSNKEKIGCGRWRKGGDGEGGGGGWSGRWFRN